MQEVILAFKNQIPKVGAELKLKSEELKYDFSHVEKDKKHSKNKLSEEYYKRHILGDS